MLDYLAVPSVMTRVFLSEEGGRRVSVRGMQCERDSMAIAGLEDGGRGQEPWEAASRIWKRQEAYPPAEPPQKSPALQTQ